MLRTDIHDDYRPTLLTEILRQHFAWADEAMRTAIEAGADYIDLASGQALFHQGDTGDDVYFVLSGRLRALATTSDGEPHAVGEIARGETIGELALFTGEARSATIFAIRDSTLARVSRALVERCIAHNPALALTLTRRVIERFRQRDEARPAPIVPAIVCVLPISPNVDANGFAEALRRHRPESFGPIAVFSEPPGVRPARWQSQLDAMEGDHAAVYLTAGRSDTEWTRFCLRHADEIILLGDAAADPSPAAAEATLLRGESPISIARQTLVLLHGAGTRTPRFTSQWLAPRNRPRHIHIRPTLCADMRRLARIIAGRAVGLVLAGGGARGFAHVGVYQALEAAGVEIDYVGGTSIGALMGTLMALDVRGDDLQRGVREGFLAHPSGNITGDYNLLPVLSLLKGTRGRESLAVAVRRQAGADIDLEDSWKNFFVMASDFTSGREEVLTHGPLVPAVSASFAIPGALPPVLIDGHLMFDGGTFNNFPVDVMAGLGAGRIIGVDVSADLGPPLGFSDLPVPSALLRDRLRPRAAQLYAGLPTLPETMIMSSFVTSMSRQRAQRRFADLLFRPPLPHMGLLDWHRFDDAVAAGRTHATAMLAGMSADELAEFR